MRHDLSSPIGTPSEKSRHHREEKSHHHHHHRCRQSHHHHYRRHVAELSMCDFPHCFCTENCVLLSATSMAHEMRHDFPAALCHSWGGGMLLSMHDCFIQGSLQTSVAQKLNEKLLAQIDSFRRSDRACKKTALANSSHNKKTDGLCETIACAIGHFDVKVSCREKVDKRVRRREEKEEKQRETKRTRDKC